jgi:hypothetical protein
MITWRRLLTGIFEVMWNSLIILIARVTLFCLAFRGAGRIASHIDESIPPRSMP